MKSTRYKILKKKFPNYLILVKYKNHHITFNIDKIILNFINSKTNDLYAFLDNNKINYIILNTDNTITIKNYEINNYYKYYYISILNHLL